MSQAGKFLKIEVIDHLIISDETYHSFVESGIFKKLQASEKWILPYKLKERYKNEGKEEGRKEEKMEMAKLMKKDKKTTEEIQKYTQLPIEEIQKL